MRQGRLFTVLLFLTVVLPTAVLAVSADDISGIGVYMLELEKDAEPTAVYEEIKSRYPEAELLYVYRNVFNGLAVRLSDGDGLSSFDAVSCYEKSESFEPDSDGDIAADSLLRAFEGYHSGGKYRGEGMVAAVIDTSFDVDHEMFVLSEDTVPAITEEDVDEALKKGIAASNHLMAFPEKKVYISEKIPYAFNYASFGAPLSGLSSHGTHVAGILAANAKGSKNSFDGAAPEAQLLLMATSDPTTGTSDNYVVVAAIDDAIALGADVISMSLGSYSGFSEASGQDTMIYKAISKAVSAGIPVVCSAGNEYRVGAGSLYDSENGVAAPLASNPDNGTLNSPASFPEVIAVASAYSGYIAYTGIVSGEDGKPIDYTVGSAGYDFLKGLGDGRYYYVEVGGLGEASEYRNINVKGKIALVKRGELTFIEKIKAAEQNGAAAVIVYDNEYESELIAMDTAGTHIPAVFISRRDGEKLLAASGKYIDITCYDRYYEMNIGDVRMSQYSSSGVTPELLLKPEVTAFGENILSGVGDSQYAKMSGTSMATPAVSGGILLLKQKYRAEDKKELTVEEIKNIIMNTARPAESENGEYSPRRQGAGLVDIEAAISAEAIALGEGGTAKIELGEINGTRFGFTVTVENLGDAEKSYEISASVMSDGYEYDNAVGKNFISENSEIFENALIYANGKKININRHQKMPDTLTVNIPAGEKKEISFEVILDAEDVKLYNKIFENGYFVEGYVYFSTDSEELSLPYMGFCGDWDALEVLDRPDEPFFGFSLTSGKWNGLFVESVYLGYNHFSGNTDYEADERCYIISPNGDGYLDNLGVILALLRNADDIVFKISDNDGNTVYEKSGGSQRKSFYFKEYGTVALVNEPAVWDGTESDNYRYTLPDGKYTLTVEASPASDGATQSFSLPIILDTEKPKLVKAKLSEDEKKLEVTVSDENYIQSVFLYDPTLTDETDKYGWQKILEGEENTSEYTAVFDIEDFESRVLYLEIVDYGYNKTVVRFDLDKLAA